MLLSEHPEVHEEEKEAEEEAVPQRKTRGRKRKTPEDAEQERQGMEEQFEQLQAEQPERGTRSTRSRADQLRQEQEASAQNEEVPLFPEEAIPPMPDAVCFSIPVIIVFKSIKTTDLVLSKGHFLDDTCTVLSFSSVSVRFAAIFSFIAYVL